MKTSHLLFLMSTLLVKFWTIPLAQNTPEEDEDVRLISGNIRSREGIFLSQRVAKLANNLFNNLLSEAPRSSSVLFSPLSIYLALSLLYPGSGGQTESQLAQILGIENDIQDSDFQKHIYGLLQSYKSLISVYPTKIALANALFADNSFSIMPDYKEVITNFYQGHVTTLDFSNQIESAGSINGWVRNRTEGLITKLVEPTSINGDTRMMILNAVYFKANWKNKFAPTQTRKETFFINNQKSRSVEVDMMSQADNLLVGRDEELQADILSLQYEDPNFTMLIFLPDEYQNSETLEERLGSKNFSDVHLNLEYRLTEVQMPKFRLEYKTRLVSTLKKMGLIDIFDEQKADLSGLSSEEDLSVTDILHKAVVEVNEEGSEAAAVTGITIAIRGGFSVNQFIMNRPFIFVIQDLKNHIPLFLGHVMNPTTEEGSSVQNNLYDYYDDSEPKLVGFRSTDDDISICLTYEPCKNGGTCATSGTDLQDYVCVCSSGFEGKQCQVETNYIKDEPDLIVSERNVFDVLGDDSFSDDEKKTGHPAGDNCEPGFNFTASESGNGTHPVRFPCPHTEDTQPIKDYKSRNGDPSLLGNHGENAKLPLLS